jgi:hypothetical protein
MYGSEVAPALAVVLPAPVAGSEVGLGAEKMVAWGAQAAGSGVASEVARWVVLAIAAVQAPPMIHSDKVGVGAAFEAVDPAALAL